MIPYRSNCLLYAVTYRLRHADSYICAHRGRWWSWVPHFYIEHGEQILDFKSYPGRNGTPFLFTGKPRTRTREALQRYLAQKPTTMPNRLIHHAPTFNTDTQLWDVQINEASTGEYVRTQDGFATKTAAQDWSLQQAINAVVGKAAAEVEETGPTKVTGSSRLSL